MSNLIVGEQFTETFQTYDATGDPALFNYTNADVLPVVDLYRNAVDSTIDATVSNIAPGVYTYTQTIPADWNSTDDVSALITVTMDGIQYQVTQSLEFANLPSGVDFDYAQMAAAVAQELDGGISVYAGQMFGVIDSSNSCAPDNLHTIKSGSRFNQLVTLKRQAGDCVQGLQFEIAGDSVVSVSLLDKRKNELISEQLSLQGEGDWPRSRISVDLSSTLTGAVTYCGTGYLRVKILDASNSVELSDIPVRID